jgi:hypothetical protein
MAAGDAAPMQRRRRAAAPLGRFRVYVNGQFACTLHASSTESAERQAHSLLVVRAV